MKQLAWKGSVLLGTLILGACVTIEPVQPWQRGDLARPEMAFEPDPLQAAYRRHVDFSKEAASGGATLSGGGCGCN
jgi:hypothetical protein